MKPTYSSDKKGSITFVGAMESSLSHKCNIFLRRSSVGQVVCESIIIIQLHSSLLDRKRSITFVGAMGCSLSDKCYTLSW